METVTQELKVEDEANYWSISITVISHIWRSCRSLTFIWLFGFYSQLVYLIHVAAGAGGRGLIW